MLVRLNALMTAVALLNSGALAQGVNLTDPQIAHIAYTAGKLDITAAKQALERSENKAVKAFAADMVRDHEALNKQAIALVKKLKVTPKDNDTSRMLSRERYRQDQGAVEVKGRRIRQGLRRQRNHLSQDGRRYRLKTFSFRRLAVWS